MKEVKFTKYDRKKFIENFGENFYKLITREKKENTQLIYKSFCSQNQKCDTDSLLKALGFVLFDIKNVSVVNYLEKGKFLKFLKMLCNYFESNDTKIIENRLQMVDDITKLDLKEIERLRTKMKINKDKFPGIYGIINTIYKTLTERNIILINKISQNLNDKKLTFEKIEILPEELIKFLKCPIFINILYLTPIKILEEKLKN